MKNNCKRFVSLMLALIMVIALMPVGHVHAEEETVRVPGGMVTEVAANETYLIALHGTGKYLTNQAGSGAWGTHTLSMADSNVAEAKNTWTLIPEGEGYKIQNELGYLALGNNSLDFSETGDIFTLNYLGDDGWTIGAVCSDGVMRYFNHLGGTAYGYTIGGWTADGTKFDIYSIDEQSWDEIDPWGKRNWVKVSVDTETVYNENEGLFEYAWDSNPDSIWHSNWQGASDKLTGENTFAGVIDFGKVYTINQFSFTPRLTGNLSGIITQASLYVSAVENPGEGDWTLVAEHTAFEANRDKKNIDFAEQEVRFVKFVAEQSNDGWVAVSEFDIDYVEPAAHEHSYEAVVTTAATCTEDGVMTYTCSCSDSYTEVIPATGHAWDNDQDTDCNNGCGYTREVETVTSEKIEGITGQGSSVDTSEPAHDKSVANAFDGNTDTFWATVPGGSLEDAYLLINLGGVYPVNKVEYTKRYDAGAKYNCTGNLLDYIIEVSTDDGVSWEQVAAGETVDGTTVIEFEPVMASQIRLTATRSYHWDAAQANTVMTVAELAVYRNVVQGCEHPDTDVFCWIEVPATCTEEGSYALIWCCAVCGGEVSRENHILEPSGHAEVTIPGREPTCTETGLTEGKECCVCLEQIVPQEEIPALGHEENTWYYGGNENGKHVKVVDCGRCGESTQTEENCSGGQATCMAPATCEYCDLNYGESLPPHELVLPYSGTIESEESWDHVYAWTATANGKLTCTFSEGLSWSITCGEDYYSYDNTGMYTFTLQVNEGETVLVNPWTYDAGTFTWSVTFDADCSHNWVDATCTTPKTCSLCGATEGEALGHTEEVIPGKDATCTETGLTEGKKCSVCGEVITAQEEIPALGHSYEAVVTGPDCENGGYTTYTCSVCGDSYVDDETEALGHDFEAQVFEPTCTDLGFTHYTCTVCGFAYDGDEVPATGHTEKILPAVPATCTSTGLTEGCVCAVCGYVIVAQEIIPAAEHPYEAAVTAPTCTEAGYTTYTCSVCGDSYVADHVDPLGHTEEVIPGKDATCTEPGLTEGKKCAVCGVVITAQEEIPALGHTEEVVPGKEATCTESGLTEGKKCSVCGEVITAQEELPALGHDFVDGSCTRCGEADPDAVEVIATGWSGYTTWKLTADGVLTFAPSGQTLENGETNMKNYWKVGGVLTLPWGAYAELITKVVIEEGVHDIGQMAFYELPNLVEVQLPSTIVEIRGYAFKNCKSLTTINLDGVDVIREGAFYGCSALENVTFAEGVVIEDWAFTRTSVVMP